MARKEYERQQEDNEGRIFGSNFGGLNSTANPLNIPYEDSPFLLNTITDIQGNILKRPGTRVIFSNDVSADGVSLTPFSTGLNYNFLVAKQGKFIRVYEAFNDTANMVVEKANVFDDRAKDVRAFILATSEVEPRLIFLTGTNKPVQLKFIEQQHVQAIAGVGVVFSNASRFKNATTSNIVAFINRVRTTPASVSYNSSTQQLIVNFPSSVAVNDVVDIVLITWQWWAEGVAWKGSNVYSTANRFNVTPIDQNVAIPETLTNDLDPKDTSKGLWDIIAYRKGARVIGSSYARIQTHNPQTEDEYSHGDGNRYIPGTNNFTRPTPYYLTFGTTQTAYTGLTPTPAANTPTTVHLIRYRQLKFNNNKGILSAHVQVFVNGIKRTQILTNGDAADNVEQNYWLYTDTAVSVSAETVGTALAYQVGFNGLAKLGLPSSSLVEFANTNRTHIGTAALTSRFDFNDGSYTIAYGLGTVADYEAGYYPTVGAIYQNRLVLGGFGHRPLTAVFSSTLDSSVPGQFYSDFHITDANTLDTAPFDVVINSKPDDRLVTFVEWQSSLFALTRKAVFRLTGGDSPISPSARYVNFISATGCVNHSCVAQTDTSAVYLSDTGLYDLTPMVENGEYQVRERSLKIRDKFGITDDAAYENLPWVAYDINNRYVMVAYPAPGQTTTTRYIYVYNTFRDSWTEFNTPGGFNTFHGTRYVDRQLGQKFMVACTTELWQVVNDPQNIIFLAFDDSRYLDFRQVFTHVDEEADYYTTPPSEVVHHIITPQQHFGVTFTATRQARAFTQHPVIEVEDIAVYHQRLGEPQVTLLVKDVDWVKEPSGYIYLLGVPQPGETLFIRQHIPNFNNGQQVLVNNVNHTSYEVKVVGSGANSKHYINVYDAAINSTVEIGRPYLSIYTTPLFANQSLANFKKMKHVYLFFDNRGIQRLYTGADTNLAAGQDPAQLVDTYVQKASANVTITYNSTFSGDTSTDLYGNDELFWDESFMDIAPPFGQHQLYQTFKEPIQGVGYSYQMTVWNYDDTTFKLCGYSIDATRKGKRYSQR